MDESGWCLPAFGVGRLLEPAKVIGGAVCGDDSGYDIRDGPQDDCPTPWQRRWKRCAEDWYRRNNAHLGVQVLLLTRHAMSTRIASRALRDGVSHDADQHQEDDDPMVKPSNARERRRWHPAKGEWLALRFDVLSYNLTRPDGYGVFHGPDEHSAHQNDAR